jgi:hypothetical protein
MRNFENMARGRDPISPRYVQASRGGKSCGLRYTIHSASTATKWYGHEGDILRYVFFYSIALACLVGILVTLQAYVYPFTLLVH